MMTTTNFEPLTVTQAKQLAHGTTLYERDGRNSDGTARRWRVNGKPKTWKTRPNDVSVPLKHGLYQYGTVGNVGCTFGLDELSLRDPTEGA